MDDIPNRTDRIKSKESQRIAFCNRKERAVLQLLLTELVEAIVPLTYVIGFSMAYFGPNGKLIGNVLCDLWTYRKVEDVEGLYTIQLLLFGVDAICVLLNTLILFLFGNVNLIQELSKVLKHFWMILAVVMANQITAYFGLNDINVANDMTYAFTWITKEGRSELINNSTYLTDEAKSMLLAD